MITLFKGLLRSSEPNLMLPISLDDLANLIQFDTTLMAETNRIRQLKTLDPSAADKAKTRLPYFAWNKFDNNERQTSHFVSSSLFCFDIDHYSNEANDLYELAQQLFILPYTVLCYRSPGGTGLKVLMVYEPECFEAETYTKLYKECARWLSSKYELEGFLDPVTHDAARISFLGHDERLLWKNPISALNTGLFIQDRINNVAPLFVYNNEAIPIEDKKQVSSQNKPEAIPYKEILQKLNPGSSRIAKYPQTLHADIMQILPGIKQGLRSNQVQIIDEKPIQYGISFSLQNSQGFSAYINVFVGKNGYSIVPVGKRGHHPSFTEEMHALMMNIMRNAQKTIEPQRPLIAVS